MAVTSCTELRTSCEGKLSSDDRRQVREYVRKFQVLLDVPLPAQSTAALLSAIGVTLFSPYPGDVTAIAKAIAWRAESDDGRRVTVTVDYSSAAAEVNEDEDQSPVSRPAEIRWDSANYQEVVEKDEKTGRPIANSAGDRFDPPVEREASDHVLVISRNEAWFDHERYGDYKNAVNTDTFWGQPKYSWKVNNIAGEYVREGKWTYWRVTYELAWRPKTWVQEVPDLGFYHFLPGGQDARIRTKARDANSELADVPVKLDGNGVLLPNQEDDPEYLSFHRYKLKPFQPLNLSAVLP